MTTVPISMNIILRGQLGFMSDHFEVVGVTGSDEKHFEEIRERENIRMIAVDMDRGISPAKDIISLGRLIRCFRKEKPFIVHTHTPKAGFLGMLAGRICNVPIRIHTVAGLPLLETTGLKRKLLNSVEKFTYKMATKLYPNSYGLKEVIIEEGFCKADKAKVIGNGSSNGVDLDRFSINYTEFPEKQRLEVRNEYGITPDEKVLVYVGRLAKDKGVEELLEAFSTICTNFNNVKLLLVGPMEKINGPISNASIRQIDQHPQIIYNGRKDDIRPMLLASDIFIFPSYREGFPNVLLQAGAMNLPCLASDINGCNEIIEEGINGLLFPPKDTGALYEVLDYALSHSSHLDSMRKVARQMIAAKFQQSYLWSKWLEEYNSLINEYNSSSK